MQQLLELSNSLLSKVKTSGRTKSPTNMIKQNRIIIENKSLKKELDTLKIEKQELADKYHQRIRKIKFKYQNKISEARSTDVHSRGQGYTTEQKDLMIQDYESLLSTLENEHLMMQEQSGIYKNIADEKDHTSSEILTILLNHMKNQAQNADTSRKSRRRFTSEDNQDVLGSSLVMFKPKKNLNSSIEPQKLVKGIDEQSMKMNPEDTQFNIQVISPQSSYNQQDL